MTAGDVEPDELLSIGPAAAELGVSVKTLRNWSDAGRVAVIVHPTGHRRFRRSEIRRLLASMNRDASDQRGPVTTEATTLHR